jgi:hypothetical protein
LIFERKLKVPLTDFFFPILDEDTNETFFDNEEKVKMRGNQRHLKIILCRNMKTTLYSIMTTFPTIEIIIKNITEVSPKSREK